ncbi:MAG: FAD-dependent oxidoreductase [Desulfarculus sp.]|nr:FAD-dependent oxidoreductase [Desulfarculus sp.]
MAGAGKKDARPSKAVLILGSGFGALKVAEDLSLAGLPVAWATRAANFLELPQGVKPFPEWPEDLSFQFRPLYLRVTRNPLVTLLPQARLEALEAGGQGYRARVEQDPRYIDQDQCTGCDRCREACPLSQAEHPPLTRSPAYCPSRALQLDKRPVSPCRLACPLGVNAQAYLALTAAQRYGEALAVIRRDNPLPGVCGRVCHHPCEAACRRGELDKPLAIRGIKRFLFDHEARHGLPKIEAPPLKADAPRVAVVGSGPAGLTAAHFLRQWGLKVTVLEALAQTGGMLRAGINAFRLPRRVLDAEIEALRQSGIEIKTSARVTSLEDLLEQGFAAVLLATGTHEDLSLNLPGEDLRGVRHCVEFLRQVNLEGRAPMGERVVVIGGGNSAMDAARTAYRLGASEVTVLAIEDESSLPAHPEEVRQAREEGVRFSLGAAPVELVGQSRIEAVKARPAHWEIGEGQPPRIVYDSPRAFTLEADTLIVAIGQRPHLHQDGLEKGLTLGRGGRLTVDEAGRTNLPKVFAAGDVVTGPSTVVGSMAQGRRAAGQVHAFLTGQPSPVEELTPASHGVGDYLAIGEDLPQLPRQEMAQRQPKARCRDFEEVEFGYSDEQAQAEAKRCLNCASCCECLACQEACQEVGAIGHDRGPRRLELDCPAVIVADAAELPPALAPQGANIYRLDQAGHTSDLMDVLMAGSAAAGQAMAVTARLRRGALQPEPERAPEPGPAGHPPRVGFFLCTCNQTMAPPEVLRGLLDLAAKVPDTVHRQSVFSCCHPRGAAEIARVVRAQGLNRVILGSCVCCPLNFHCISCNDQRSRAKQHLFEELGLVRCTFEPVNLRDHLAAGSPTPQQMMERGRDLLRGAFIRSRYLGPLTQGLTDMGRRVLVLGGSEVGLSCALNLALQGLKVRLVDKANLEGQDLPPDIAGRPTPTDFPAAISLVPRAEILSITGSIGDFQVSARVGGNKRTWQADVVCLTDPNILELAPYAGEAGLKKFYRYDFAFFHTPQLGLYRVMPRTLLRVKAFEAGAALAAEVADAAAQAFLSDHQLSPRVDPERCRGCGRCEAICPFDAVRLVPGQGGLYTSQVLRHNCVGCGGCVGRCPVTAMDTPYFSNRLLEKLVAGQPFTER